MVKMFSKYIFNPHLLHPDSPGQEPILGSPPVLPEDLVPGVSGLADLGVKHPVHHVVRTHRADPLLLWYLIERRLQTGPVERSIAVFTDDHVTQSVTDSAVILLS